MDAYDQGKALIYQRYLDDAIGRLIEELPFEVDTWFITLNVIDSGKGAVVSSYDFEDDGSTLKGLIAASVKVLLKELEVDNVDPGMEE